MTDMKAPFKPDGWSYKDMEFWEYYENEIQVTIAIQKDIRTMKGLKLAYISGSMTTIVNPLSREAICKKVKYLMSSKKRSVCLVDEGHQFLQRQTYLFLKKLKDLSVCQEFLKVVDEADFFDYMDFLKHNHAKECPDRLRISEIQIKRGDVLKYKVFGQEFLYSIKENSVSMPNAVLSRLKKLAGFEKEYRTVIKSCLKIADKIGCPQYRVTENLDVRVCALVGKRYAEQVFPPEEFSPASLRRWYKEKAKEFEEEEKEQERQKIKRAKSLKSFGNLLASDIYDLVCLNDYITESAIVKNLRGMKQTFQATIKDVENSGKYGLLTNEEVERVYSQMKREKLISEKGIDGTYGEFYIVKPQPEGKLISEIHIEEKKEYAKFLDTDWVSYMKKVISAGKERKPTKKEDQEQMKLLVEGAPGVGKTSLAKALAEVMGLPMLRLQMYDGLTKDEVLYDYDYQRQLLTLEAVKPKLNEEIKDLGINDAIKHVAGDVDFYGKEFLIPRPVLQTIDGSGRKLLLIDEIDKASEETEYMLYEYLEDYSIDIPQFGTVSCPEDQKPVVILTSNAYRELSGAMKRRCSYLYIKKKTRAEIIEVLKYRTSVDERVASGIASCMVAFQEMDLKHPVSVSEIVDWASYIEKDGSREGVQNSLGLLVKDRRDMEAVSATVRNYIHDIAY